MGTRVEMYTVVKNSWIELKAEDGRFWRFSTEEEARTFARENGLVINGEGGRHHG